MSLEQSIFNRLTDPQKAPQVARLIRNPNGTHRIYPGLIDESAATPNIAYETDDGAPVRHINGVEGLTRTNMTLTCWGKRTEEAKELRTEIRMNVSGLGGQHVGPHFIRLIQVNDGGDVQYTSGGNKPLDRKGVQLDLDIWHLEQVPSPGV